MNIRMRGHLKKNVLRFMVFMGFLLVVGSNALRAQSLILTDEKIAKNLEEEEVLYSNESRFLGFSTGLWKTRTSAYSLRQSWLKPFDDGRAFMIRPQVLFVADREEEIRVRTMGTQQHPVYRSTLFSDSEGYLAKRGESFFANAMADWQPSDWFHSRLELGAGTRLSDGASLWQIRQFYAEARYNKMILSVGRKPIHWGQGTSSFLLSTNAANLDVIQLTTLPVTWPWIFKYLGQLKAELFYSRMNSDRSPEHDQFFGWYLGWMPKRWIEMNIGMHFQFGGDGMPEGPLSEYILEILGARKNYSDAPNDASNWTNRSVQGDFRVHLNDLGLPLSLYTTQQLEDCCATPGFDIKHKLSYTYGLLWVPKKQTRFRLEYTKSTDSLYIHVTWPSGTSNQGRIMGHNLGRDSQAVYARWGQEWGFAKIDSDLGLFWEQRDRKGWYYVTPDQPPVPTRFYYPEFQSSEKRSGAGLKLKWNLAPRVFADFGVVSFRVWNKDNIHGRNDWEFGFLSSLSSYF